MAPTGSAGTRAEMSEPGLRRLATATASAAVAVALAATWLMVVGRSQGVPAYEAAVGDIAVGMSFPVAGLLVVRRQPRNRAGWVLLSASLIAVSALSHQWVTHIAVVGEGSLPGRDVAVWLASWTFVPYFLQPTLLPLWFPDGEPASPRWRRFGHVVLGLVVTAAVAASLRPGGDLEELGFANPLGTDVPWVQAILLVLTYGTAIFCLFVAAPAAMASLVARARRASGELRSQLQWLLVGFLSYLVLLVLGNLPGLEEAGEDAFFLLAFLSIPASIAIAVVRHGFLDVEFVLNRAVAYVGLSLLALGVYLAGVTAFGRWVGARDIAPLAAAAAAFVAALARERVQRGVERWLYGERADPVAVVDHVGARVSLSPPAQGLQVLAEAIAETLRLPFVAVVPVDPAAPSAEVGTPVADVEHFPVVLGGEQVAQLQVGHRHARERFRPEELVAIGDAARRAAVVLHAADLTSELRRSREEIVAAREEERRRLRNDLHDGVGPSLAGMALQLDGLVSRLADSPELAARADRLRGSLADVVVEVRRIVDGLRPAPVAELGLVEALRLLAQGDGEPRVEVRAPATVAPLPAAVEVAAYRIATEALANAMRHARARTCRLELEVSPAEVVVRVSDDGAGFARDRSGQGVGLVSMAERAAEVGGMVDVRSQSGQGVVVEARLPLEAR